MVLAYWEVIKSEGNMDSLCTIKEMPVPYLQEIAFVVIVSNIAIIAFALPIVNL